MAPSGWLPSELLGAVGAPYEAEDAGSDENVVIELVALGVIEGVIGSSVD